MHAGQARAQRMFPSNIKLKKIFDFVTLIVAWLLVPNVDTEWHQKHSKWLGGDNLVDEGGWRLIPAARKDKITWSRFPTKQAETSEGARAS